MKELKRIFRMTKEQVEYNLKILPYHRKFVMVSEQQNAIRRDNTLSRVEKRDEIMRLRNELVAQWREVNE